MSHLHPATSTAADGRQIGLRTRSDLVIRESVFQGETCWIVKDPLAMKYFRLREPEYIVLWELSGATTYSRLKQLLIQRFPEQKLRLETIEQLVVSFHRNGLLITDATGQATPLRRKRNRELKQKATGLLSSIVSLRLPGFDPEPILGWLYPKFALCFTRWFNAIAIAVCLAALTLVVSNFSEFYSRLPDFQSFFALDNLLFMAGILIFTKTIHEFGHGLACKHFGGECHEIGFMFLVFTPAMYCNTSDSWILPNRWHRIAIGAAGMYVECLLAAICTFVWWFTHPGWVHYFCLNLMFLSSFSTIVFNINPLLRYDGYYMLSDLLEIPNLAQKARMALLSKLRVICLGMKPVDARMLPQRHQELFAIYAVASFVYRWAILIMIFWFISGIFEPWGLAAIGHLVIAISLFGMIVLPLWKLFKFLSAPDRLREVKKFRFYFTLAIVASVAGAVAFVPVPHFVHAEFVLRPYQPQRVVVTQPGNIRRVLVQPGDQVEAGALLAELFNPELELELEQLRGELARLEHDLTKYQLARSSFLDASRMIVETEAAIADITQQIELKQLQAGRLKLLANRAGEVFSPPNQLAAATADGTLERWDESPLEERNHGAWLDANTLFCLIADPNRLEAVLVVSESDLPLLAPGQSVSMVPVQFRDTVIRSELEFVARDQLQVVPRELSQSNGGPIPVQSDGSESPLLKQFEASAILNADQLRESNVIPISGSYGTAKIRVGHSSIGNQLLRYLRTIINFR